MLKFDDKDLIPTIIQNNDTGKVLMLGYINEESLKITLKTGKVCFYSRSRKKLWQKGETSGNYLNIRSIYIDCDEDTLLIQVDPIGPTCHTGAESCFYRTLESIK
jgi:phosphoribosyl-AMP cyclohydrolase